MAVIEREPALTNASVVLIGAHTISSPMFASKVSHIDKLPDLSIDYLWALAGIGGGVRRRQLGAQNVLR